MDPDSPKLLTDEEKIDEAYRLLCSLVEEKESCIEPAFWIGPMMQVMAHIFENAGASSEEFMRDMLEGVKFYSY